MTVSVFATGSEASTTPRANGWTWISAACGLLAELDAAGITSTAMPTSRAAVPPLDACVSSSITVAPLVANSWPFTNTLPNAVIAPEDTEAPLAVSIRAAADPAGPPPPQADSDNKTTAHAEENRRFTIFIGVPGNRSEDVGTSFRAVAAPASRQRRFCEPSRVALLRSR